MVLHLMNHFVALEDFYSSIFPFSVGRWKRWPTKNRFHHDQIRCSQGKNRSVHMARCRCIDSILNKSMMNFLEEDFSSSNVLPPSSFDKLARLQMLIIPSNPRLVFIVSGDQRDVFQIIVKDMRSDWITKKAREMFRDPTISLCFCLKSNVFPAICWSIHDPKEGKCFPFSWFGSSFGENRWRTADFHVKTKSVLLTDGIFNSTFLNIWSNRSKMIDSGEGTL